MSRKRRKFTREFKVEALRLVEESGKPLTQVARELGVRLSDGRREEQHARECAAMFRIRLRQRREVAWCIHQPCRTIRSRRSFCPIIASISSVKRSAYASA